jgi:hypothetical protein
MHSFTIPSTTNQAVELRVASGLVPVGSHVGRPRWSPTYAGERPVHMNERRSSKSYVVVGASLSASASSILSWISGERVRKGWKLCALIDRSRDGAVSVTVAVLGRRRISANSPKKSPGASVATRRFCRRTSAPPSIRTKNEYATDASSSISV